MTLGERYGFRAGYPLSKELDRLRARVTRWRRETEHMVRPTFKQRQDAVDGFAKAARKLVTAATELARVGGGYLLADEDGEPLLDVDALRQVERQAREGSVSDKPMRGERDDLVSRWTVACLLRVYRRGTGRVDIGGRFAAFAEEAAGLVGVEIDRRVVIRVADRIHRKQSNPATVPG
jgi:hypothetical protein